MGYSMHYVAQNSAGQPGTLHGFARWASLTLHDARSRSFALDSSVFGLLLPLLEASVEKKTRAGSSAA